jgi:hypothetical protein
MTRRDWWLGIAIFLLALILQTFVILRADDRRAAERWGVRPLTQSVAAYGR